MIGSQRARYRAAVNAAARGQNPNDAVTSNYSRLDRMAIVVTGKVGTMKFSLIIIGWTVLWVGYNVLATAFHLPRFDNFPALVAYLLISNVIQICLMPLIMVGQNMQARQSEAKAEQDYANNKRAVEILEQLVRGDTP